MPIGLEQSAESSVLRLDGVIDISCAAELKTVLLQALGQGRAVRVSLEGVTGLDVTAVELLWAAEREARRSSVLFTLTGEASEQVSAALRHAGFDEFPVPAHARPVRG